MFRRLIRFMTTLSIVTLIALPFAGCKENTSGSGSSQNQANQVTYKCGCGKTVTVDAGAPAPSC